MLGVADQYGTLEPGKKANFIVLEKDPTQDIHNTQTIRAVWKNGAKVSDGPGTGRAIVGSLRMVQLGKQAV